MQHLPENILMCGPSHGWAMFAYERFMSFLRGRIHNRKDPEVTAVESYRVSSSDMPYFIFLYPSRIG